MTPARLFALGVAAIVLACVLAFAPVRGSRFLQDDHPIVQLNPIVHRGDWREIFATDYWGGVGGSETNLYRPVTIGSFALERGRDGNVDPARAHRTNVLLHALASLALVALALRLGAGRAAALLAGALFALHPIHVSVVAGLVGRAEILAALFTLLALLCQSAAHAGPLGSRLASWSAGLCVFLALGSKEVAVAAPILLLLLELGFRPESSGNARGRLLERAAALAPSALACAIYATLRLHALGVFPAVQRPRLSENVLVGLAGVERVATALGLAARYLALLCFPSSLSADYSGNVIGTERGLLSPLPLVGALWLLFLIACAFAPWLALRKGAAPTPWLLPSFAALLFLLPYLAIGNLFVLVGIGFAERLAYLPSLGFCLLLALALARVLLVPSRRPAGVVVVAILLAVAGFRTRAACHDFKNDETLFTAVLRTAPESPRAQFTLGKIRLEQGRSREALALFTRAAELWPQYSAAWLEKGRLEAAHGDRAGAAASIEKAVRLNPWQADAAVLLADLWFEEARYADAARMYRRALRLGRTDVLTRARESEGRASR